MNEFEQVTIVVDWRTFTAFALATVVGFALYELAKITLEWFADFCGRAADDVRDWWSEKYPDGFMPHLWGRAVGSSNQAPEFVPDPHEAPKEREHRWRIMTNGTLHRASCRIVNAQPVFSPGYPWPWADTEEEARHYAEVQELRPCGVCSPCGDLTGVAQWWK